MTNENRRSGRRTRSGFRAWYVVKDACAMIGGAVVLYHACRFIEPYLHGPSVF